MNKQIRQPWFHSALVDSLGFYAMPIIVCLISIFFFNQLTLDAIVTLAALIGFIDFGHIFAQWLRVHQNPLETKRNFHIYLALCGGFVIVFTILLMFGWKLQLRTFLVYYVIYHVMRQQYGIIRIYSRTDKRYNQFQDWCFKIFVQCSMIYPIIWWHGQDRLSRFFWKGFFIEIPYINIISNILMIIYGLSFVVYLFYEVKMTKENKFFNIPKNLMVIGTVLGWHYGIMYSQYAVFILFTILFTHNLSYFVLIWIISRRDAKLQNIPLQKGFKSIFQYATVPGFFTFFFIVNGFSILYLDTINWTVHGWESQYAIVKTVLSYLPTLGEDSNFLKSFIYSFYLTALITHYIIDAKLWKKEKDYAFYLRSQKS